ncbi:stage III sporulation protein AE [Desulfofundulus thermobenzoicus]|uniref:Stage III sporulation protein AE n=1 Tax=Desulfofundulus thermobenzoicus TaxID=29376 RepID=A0A6N7IRG4_9FIRM|nr:stage III sporulation protein AE [Desulfofundulus thermobenzoicus]MQL52109.1 stage III sporulation protein AE [Desulfofundulus thermobenzoicus]
MTRFGWYMALTLCLMMFLSCPAYAPGEEVSPGKPEAAAAGDPVDMSGAGDLVNRLDEEIQRAVPGFNFKELVTKLLKREMDWSPVTLLHTGLTYLFREVVANAALLGKLVILAMICAVLQNFATAFERGTTGQLTHTVAFLVLVTIATGSFALAVQTGREVVDRMVGVMQALLPVLLTLLVALGGVASAAIFHPVILVSLTVIGTLVKDIVLPLIFFSALLGLVSHLSPRFKVSNLAGLFKTVALGLMGLCGTVFLGLLAVQGVAGAVGDGVILRTARFSLDAFVPVVGGMFSDALEAVIGSALLIKNALGIAGVVAVFFVMTLPLIKLLSLAFIYKLAGALIQPVDDSRVADCLNDLGNGVISIFAAVATVGLVFFFAIAIVVGVGNLTVMLR